MPDLCPPTAALSGQGCRAYRRVGARLFGRLIAPSPFLPSWASTARRQALLAYLSRPRRTDNTRICRSAVASASPAARRVYGIGRLWPRRGRARSTVIAPVRCHLHDEAPVGTHQVAESQTEPCWKDPRGFGEGDQTGAGEFKHSARHLHGAAISGEYVLHPVGFRAKVCANCDGILPAESAYRCVPDGARTTSDVFEIN
jgi:hypothetical protein